MICNYQEYADAKGLKYIEVSSKKNRKVNELFGTLLMDVLTKNMIKVTHFKKGSNKETDNGKSNSGQ